MQYLSCRSHVSSARLTAPCQKNMLSGGRCLTQPGVSELPGSSVPTCSARGWMFWPFQRNSCLNTERSTDSPDSEDCDGIGRVSWPYCALLSHQTEPAMVPLRGSQVNPKLKKRNHLRWIHLTNCTERSARESAEQMQAVAPSDSAGVNRRKPLKYQ